MQSWNDDVSSSQRHQREKSSHRMLQDGRSRRQSTHADGKDRSRYTADTRQGPRSQSLNQHDQSLRKDSKSRASYDGNTSRGSNRRDRGRLEEFLPHRTDTSAQQYRRSRDEQQEDYKRFIDTDLYEGHAAFAEMDIPRGTNGKTIQCKPIVRTDQHQGTHFANSRGPGRLAHARVGLSISIHRQGKWREQPWCC